MKANYQLIPLDRIHDPENPLRSDLSIDAVEDLVASIKQIGIIEPLIVRPKGNSFEVIAGHRRLVAAGIAGLTEAPCIVREETDINAEILKLHENLTRSDIDPIDWAKHLTYLKLHFEATNAKLAEMLGMSVQWVDQHLGILTWPKDVFEALEAGLIVFSSARELAFIRDPIKRSIYLRAAVKGGVTPTMAVKWRQEANRDPNAPPTPPPSETPPSETPPPSSPPLICPVCGEEIPFDHLVTLYIHDTCQPKPSS